MYKNFVMAALVAVMPFFLVSSDEQFKKDALKSVRFARISDNTDYESISIEYREDFGYSYNYGHNKTNNNYSGRKEAYLRLEWDVNYYYDDSHSFEVSAEQFNHAKALAQVFRALNSGK